MQWKFAYLWYRRKWHLITLLLLPFSGLFGLCIAIRRSLYRTNIIKKTHFPVPVIVVGNITVGGTGKTPFVIWLANWLRAQGYYPGIVSRGVGGKKQLQPYHVTHHALSVEVGDEALLLKRHTDCPLVLCVDRVAAVRDLLQCHPCDIVISDDGLQHYRLERDIEIAMVDAVRGVGNHFLLPAGPLREPISRLQKVDFVMMNGEDHSSFIRKKNFKNLLIDPFPMSYLPTELVSLVQPQQKWNLADFPQRTVHAVAGIGHPERFFSMLRQAGFQVIPHVFPDHYLYQASDICFTDSLPIIMTEKDAVKCHSFADERYWYLNISISIHATLTQVLLSKLKSVRRGSLT